MSHGQKSKFTGTVERQIVGKGSKSEHEAIVLQQDGISKPAPQDSHTGWQSFSRYNT